jgi:hypothetical protein
MRRYGKSRRELFEELDRPVLAALPPSRFSHGDCHTRRSASTITSPSTVTRTRCRTRSSVNTSKLDSLLPPSRSIGARNASPRTCAASSAAERQR